MNQPLQITVKLKTKYLVQLKNISGIFVFPITFYITFCLSLNSILFTLTNSKLKHSALHLHLIKYNNNINQMLK